MLRLDYNFLKKFLFMLPLVLLIPLMKILWDNTNAKNVLFFISSRNLQDEATKYMYQRNNISYQLNLMKKAYGQQSCRQLKLLQASERKTETRVSEAGGWCEETSKPGSHSHKLDKGLAVALSKFLKGKTVASFGDGPGLYKKHIDSLGQVKLYKAYDGAPFCENVTEGRVQFLDLTAPQFGLPAFDWVISVEVGEHIPAKFEDVYLDNLARHAREGIILSWSVPRQGGLGHVNEKPLANVITQMNKRGFDIDKTAGEPLRNAASYRWLKKNVHVYRRIDPSSFIESDV